MAEQGQGAGKIIVTTITLEYEGPSNVVRHGYLFAGLIGLVALVSCVSCGGSTGTNAAPPSRSSVVLIVVDALRADHLGTYGYDRPTSPEIDRWSTGARVFERAYATSPWTLPSFGSILTGWLPSAHGAGIEVADRAPGVEVAAARNFVTLAAGVPTVAEILRSSGYATGAFVTNPFLDPRFGLDRGFTDYDHYEASNSEIRPAGEVVDLSLGWIDAHADRPFFVMVHLFDPHLDYDAPPPYRGRFARSDDGDLELPVRGMWPIRNRIPEISAAERAFIAAAYDEEIAYVDDQFGRLIRGLESRGLLEGSLVILTADHGEELFEHDGFEHGHSMYDEVLRVPLVVRGPGVAPARVATPVSLVDVVPTILEVAGVPIPTTIAGRSLLRAQDPAAAPRPVIAERVLYGAETKAIVAWPYKVILEVDSGVAQLFDLAADPEERQDLSATQPDTLRRLLGELSAGLSEARRLRIGVRAELGTGAGAELDEDLVRRLRALGYIGGDADVGGGTVTGAEARSAVTDPEARVAVTDSAANAGLRIRFVPDAAAFDAPPPPAPVPFDVVSADMDNDGDPDLLVNWHNLGALEIFENDGGRFRLVNPPGDDRSGVFENPGIASVFADAGGMLARARQAAHAGVFVWHDPNRRADWNFFIVPGDEPVSLTLRANRALTVKVNERFVRRADEFEADLEIDEGIRFRVNVAAVATQLRIESSLPIFAGADLQPVGRSADLWKDDPHGVAWVDVRGSAAPDIFITRGGLEGSLLPPHDPKVDRFFERRAATDGTDLLYDDVRGSIPAGYGRGRRVEWVDIDGDMVNELYIGNTDTPNVLLAADGSGGYRDIAADLGLDVTTGDTFAWLDVDGNNLDDLVFIDEEGFRIAYNRGQRAFDLRPGGDIGLLFPPGSEPDQERLFSTLSLNVLDYDSDGRLDLWLTGHGEDRRHALYRRTDGGFVDVTSATGLDRAPGVNTIVLLDIDNDGYQDALTFGPQPARLHNVDGRRFEVSPLGDELGLTVFTRGIAIDVDLDGRLDAVLIDDSRLVLRNATTGGGGFLRVLLRAAGNDPVGTVVSAVYANGMVQTQRFGSALNTKYSQGVAPLHFGIPRGTVIEELLVRWPDGRTETRVVAAGEDFVELRR